MNKTAEAPTGDVTTAAYINAMNTYLNDYSVARVAIGESEMLTSNGMFLLPGSALFSSHSHSLPFLLATICRQEAALLPYYSYVVFGEPLTGLQVVTASCSCSASAAGSRRSCPGPCMRACSRACSGSCCSFTPAPLCPLPTLLPLPRGFDSPCRWG